MVGSGALSTAIENPRECLLLTSGRTDNRAMVCCISFTTWAEVVLQSMAIHDTIVSTPCANRSRVYFFVMKMELDQTFWEVGRSGMPSD